MASKKKSSGKVGKAVVTSNNSFIMLLLATLVLVTSYWLFTQVSTGGLMNSYGDLPSSSLETEINKEKKLVVQLLEQNNSGEYGNAMITEMAGKTKVRVEVKNAPKGVLQPSHIHLGSCIDLGAVSYPLSNLVNGVSESVLNVSYDDLVSGLPLALNVHKSTSQTKMYVSCGNL